MGELYLKASNENVAESELETLEKWLWLFKSQTLENQVNMLFGTPEELAQVVALYESLAESLDPPVFFQRAFAMGGCGGQGLAGHPKNLLFLQHLYIQRYCLQIAGLYREQRPLLQNLAPNCPDLSSRQNFEQKIESLKTTPDLSPPPWIKQEPEIGRSGEQIDLKNKLQDLSTTIQNYKKLSQNTEGKNLLARWQVIGQGLESQARLFESLLKSQEIKEQQQLPKKAKRGLHNHKIALD